MLIRVFLFVIFVVMLPGSLSFAKTAKTEKVGLVVQLPEPRLDSEVSLEQVLFQRRSLRQYKYEALDLKQVSQLLWAAYGLTKPQAEPAYLRGGRRAAPSAGGRFPLDLYLVAGRVKGLEAGIYFYDSKTHSLRLLKAGDLRQALFVAGYEQSMMKDAPISIVWSATYERTSSKYGDRGRLRYVCMDMGHSGQNVYLQAEALGLGTVAVGAFDDAAVKKLVGMGPKEEPLYIMPVGKKP